MKLKKGNYIDLSEVDSQETFDKIINKFKESGCTVGDWCLIHDWSSCEFMGWSKWYNGREKFFFSSETTPYLRKVSVQDILDTSTQEEDELKASEDKLTKRFQRAITSDFADDMLVELLQLYIESGFLNSVDIIMNPDKTHPTNISLSYSDNYNKAIIKVVCEEEGRWEQDYKITMKTNEE